MYVGEYDDAQMAGFFTSLKNAVMKPVKAIQKVTNATTRILPKPLQNAVYAPIRAATKVDKVLAPVANAIAPTALKTVATIYGGQAGAAAATLATAAYKAEQQKAQIAKENARIQSALAAQGAIAVPQAMQALFASTAPTPAAVQAVTQTAPSASGAAAVLPPPTSTAYTPQMPSPQQAAVWNGLMPEPTYTPTPHTAGPAASTTGQAPMDEKTKLALYGAGALLLVLALRR